ncbi:protein KINESIN LIGHT CHAIN-RELATED 2 [Dioscorea cayenensis subsp. rotundata]|uniref:Protein KINESIN LIGHT CHAIN-RELATED 2 n=1 Tax=Dioscorea cayennensis subsp. rotundata TaxID=55577 RepID=A0AB40C7L0_DIOCR|nr:protein KINESIN LIGHT CHAIN-RELATED 2 [Dioscorea cayenensis subsp. rotundata]
MRRASSLISNLVGKSKTFSRNAPKTFPDRQLFPRCPSRHLQTFSDNTLPSSPAPVPAPAHTPSRQRKLRELSELEEKFEAATSTDEILIAFEALEPLLAPDDHKLGLACLKVGQHLESISFDDPQKTLEFALRALSILDRDSKPSISVAMALHLVGAVHYTLKRFNDSLGFLNRANRILTAIEKEGSCDFDVRPVVHAVQLQLANTKTAMGRREEALVNLRRCLDLKVEILEPDSRELGAAHRDLAEAYASVLNFKEALPLCLKALEIHEKQLGSNSVDVAHDRRLLGVIYTGLEEHEKALDQNEKSQKVLKSWGMGPDLLNAEIDQANIQIALGKFDEAIKTLKGVVEQTDNNSEVRALVFVSMAKALCSQEKFADSKRCLEISCEILKNKELVSPDMVAETFVEISALYESMNEFGTAISLLKRALSMLERLPQQQHLEGNVSAKIGWLLLLTGKVELAVPYLESAAERLKETFGPKHFGVGYIYNNLGAAYLEMNRLQSAAQMFALAKDIMDVSLGPHHADSIEACQSLANAYSTMGSYILALEFQQRVVDAWESYGPNATNELREAKRLLDELKKKASGSISEAIIHKALPHESDSLHTKSN